MTSEKIRPGSVNAHTHIYSALAPFGMPAPDPTPENFVQVLERVWWKLDRALDESSLRASARWYAAQSLLLGATTLIDHHESPNFIEGSLDVLADALDEFGVRGVVCFGATERNGGRAEATRGLEECRRFITTNTRRNVRGLVSLHASFTVSDETIRDSSALCAELRTPMHVHVAEDIADVRDAHERGYDGPLERLAALGALPPGSILAHGVHFKEAQVRRVRELDCWIVQNPRSNRGNGVGYPPALAASDRVALGTDGYPSDLRDERDALLTEAESHGDDLDAAARRAEAGIELASSLFGVDFRSGSDDGSELDRVWETPDGVERVDVEGQTLVSGGKLVHHDVAELESEARAEAAKLWKRMSALA